MRPEEASGRPVGGRDYPRNLAEFQAFFSSERDCASYLAHLRWPDGFRCPHCGHEHYWLRDDDQFLCCECRSKTSVTAGTLFDSSQLGLLKWFQVIWYVVNQTGGVSALGLQRVLGFGSYQTAWAWLHKLRRAMEPTSGKLRGTVEVDESYFGGEEAGVTGRETRTKSKVVIAVERRGGETRWSAGRARMRRIEHSDSETLIGFIEEAVEPGSTVITDGWSAYHPLGRHPDYEHIAHNVKQLKVKAHEVLPAVHRVSSLCKRWLLSTHQGSVAPSHLDYYLAEWCFRFNRRRSGHRGLLFHNLVRQAAHTSPHPYTKLLSAEKGARLRRRRKKHRRRRRVTGKSGPLRNIPQRSPKRPGGSRTRLGDDVKRLQRRPVAGRRG